jgi:hypothetical protein
VKASLVAAFLALLLGVGCRGGDDRSLQFRIYDPTGRSPIEVTTEDLEPGTAEAGQGALYVQLTDRGRERFRALTRSIAREGARRQRAQTMTLEVDGEVVTRATIDYRVFPDGIDGDQGLEFQGMSLATAVELAHRINSQ